MPQQISEIVNESVRANGYATNRSNSGKLVLRFNASPTAQRLREFLHLHPSIRITFNALVKTGGTLDPSEIQRKLPDLLREGGTSFLYEVKCKGRGCDNILDKPNLLDTNFVPPDNHSITCSRCSHQNHIRKTDYQPVYEPELDAVIKCFLRGCKERVFSPTINKRCLTCGDTVSLGEKISRSMTCTKCKLPLLVSTEFVPIDTELRDLVKDRQGTWLEWYVWSLIKEEFAAEPGIIFCKDGEKVEADIVVAREKKCIIIECKDTSDAEFIVKLSAIRTIADKYLLVTTTKLKPDVRRTMESILKQKLVIVHSKDIENLASILRNS